MLRSPEVTPGDSRLWMESGCCPHWWPWGRGCERLCGSFPPCPHLSAVLLSKKIFLFRPFLPSLQILGASVCVSCAVFFLSLLVTMVLVCESSSPAALTASRTAKTWFCLAGEMPCCSRPLLPLPNRFAWGLTGCRGSCPGAFAELFCQAAAASRAATHLENCWEWKLLMQAL